MNAHFVRGQDPKVSIGVGLISRLKPGTILQCKKQIKPRIKSSLNFSILPEWYSVVKTVKVYQKKIDLELATYDRYPKSFKLADLQFCGEEYLTLTHEEFFDHFNILKTVEESINFERGIDPMDSMKLGKFHERQLEKARGELKRILNDIQQRYGGKARVYKSVSTLGTGMRATWIPPSAPYNYGIEFGKEGEEYYFEPYKWNKSGEPFANIFYGGRKSAQEAANEMVAQWGGQELVNQWGKVKESINFERGLEPKRAMKVGHHRNDLFNEIQSMSFAEAMKSFPELGSDNDRRILSLAANMLGVPEKEVKIAMDRGTPIYNDNPLMDEYISRQWEYGKEDTLESGNMNFDLIGSSTGEIYVKDSKSDEFLYILGATN